MPAPHAIPSCPFTPPPVPHSYIGWGKTTHLGYGIPLMIGAKLAKPDKFCLNFMGDGAFGMSGLDHRDVGSSGSSYHDDSLEQRWDGHVSRRLPNRERAVRHHVYDRRLRQNSRGPRRRRDHRYSAFRGSSALRKAQQLNSDGKTALIDIHTNLEARRSNFQ